uniref:Cytoskeleton protein RodZ n=1 Tax=Candidatus Kentrum sp. LFY TaxID=2126342 RepID=A0A450UHS3_9GAMM|nr:MAG: cytoskeleton protein RodZ [Candidatus Kentron sp. LFY]
MGNHYRSMTTHLPDDPAIPVDEEDKTLGEQLREARYARNLTIDDIASCLRLSPDTIRSLEEDNYDKLPGPVFIRGYLSAYARLLRIAPSRILDAFDRRNLAPPPLTRDVANQFQGGGNHILMRITTYLIILGLVILVFSWWRTTIRPSDYAAYEEFDVSLEHPSEEPIKEVGHEEMDVASHDHVSSSSRGAEFPAVGVERDGPIGAPVREALVLDEFQGDRDEAVIASVPSSNGDLPEPAFADALPTLEKNTYSMTREVTTSTETRTSPPAPQEDRLAIYLKGNSWIEIYDGLGKKLFYQLGVSGQTYEFLGRAPFRVILGFAHAAKVIYNGEPFDHTPYIHKEIAEFQVGNMDFDLPR